jgi:hypothetical protein
VFFANPTLWRVLAFFVLASHCAAQVAPDAFVEEKLTFPITDGPFEPTWRSIAETHPGAPAWFRDAKFGVWIHWGPQAAGR